MLARLRYAGALAGGVAVLSFATALFLRPGRLLPPGVRLGSGGFIALVTAAVMAGMLRNVALGGRPAVGELAGWAIVTPLLIYLSGSRHLGAVCLFMAASIGVDLAAVAAHLVAGVDTVRHSVWFGGWQIAATAVAAMQLAAQQKDDPRS
ncbi:hypothetical protein [Methylibium petroleiphilum]|uniref:Transmembrane protein n=1 Tax=Methylibium petroleiphilum (strain ATCC BAA-1232 / LMG 22953 / PM1) TaxID=420662 RepID=A2SNJ5_METPP|nr:hypothetical protein [Methylibium petroleiphilum]ABM97134.1 hypothetical protein Mpe_B0359 [Methylibium petroleiphilum PM1]